MPRAFPTHTPLGKLIKESGLRVSDVSAYTGIYVRTMTEYLAGRKEFLPHHLLTLSRFFKVDPGHLLGPHDAPHRVDVSAVFAPVDG